MSVRQILVTTALPYANGDIHLGHLFEHIQTDIWVRFQRQQGNKCHYVCADDAHGAPIMLKAEQDGVKPEELIARVHQNHERDLRDFGINFSNYYTTHSEENRQLSESIYLKLKQAGHIVTRTISQLYDPARQMFLADRFVKGDCPQCKSQDQYGDSCEQCGSTYHATDLTNPRSTISGAKPELRESEHDFFNLPTFSTMLQEWHSKGSIQPAVLNKLSEWFAEGLRQWDITRDAPYFGFLIPGKQDKYFYVWLDAPIGYMASFANMCSKQVNLDFDHFWNADSTTELYHFIGKDIVYFHTLFWPAMLDGAGFRKPSGVFAHGFVSINGDKMSKSRGTFITARKYIETLNPEYLRYYFASKLGNGIEDIDLDLKDFVNKVNSDLGGKLVNIASRCARFINKYFDHQISAEYGEYASLPQELRQASKQIAQLYETRQFSKVTRKVMEMADKCNSLIDSHAPWKMIANPEKQLKVQQISSAMLECFWLMAGYLQPILPQLFDQARQLFNQPKSCVNNLCMEPFGNIKINEFSHLFQKLEQSKVDTLIAPIHQPT